MFRPERRCRMLQPSLDETCSQQEHAHNDCWFGAAFAFFSAAPSFRLAPAAVPDKFANRITFYDPARCINISKFGSSNLMDERAASGQKIDEFFCLQLMKRLAYGRTGDVYR